MPIPPSNYWDPITGEFIMPEGPPGYKPSLTLPWEDEWDNPVTPAAPNPVMAQAIRLIMEEGENEDSPWGGGGGRRGPETSPEGIPYDWMENPYGAVSRPNVGTFLANRALGIGGGHIDRYGNPLTGEKEYDVTWGPGRLVGSVLGAGAGAALGGMVPGGGDVGGVIDKKYGLERGVDVREGDMIGDMPPPGDLYPDGWRTPTDPVAPSPGQYSGEGGEGTGPQRPGPITRAISDLLGGRRAASVRSNISPYSSGFAGPSTRDFFAPRSGMYEETSALSGGGARPDILDQGGGGGGPPGLGGIAAGLRSAIERDQGSMAGDTGAGKG